MNSNEINAGEALFRQYGKAFQEKIFQGLLTDRIWAAQMVEVMKPDYFDLKYLAFLTDRYFKHFEKYKCFPTMQLLVSIIKEDLTSGPDAILKDQIIDFLHRMRANPDPGDLGYTKEKSLDFCKRQAFREALEKAVEMVATDKFESVVDLMKKAVSVGLANTTGHDFFEDADLTRILGSGRGRVSRSLTERTSFAVVLGVESSGLLLRQRALESRTGSQRWGRTRCGWVRTSSITRSSSPRHRSVSATTRTSAVFLLMTSLT